MDAVRYLSANSTGRTGVGVARSLRDAGHAVFLLGSPEARLRGSELPGADYGSTRDLMAQMETWVRSNPDGSVVHAAAVGDYEIADATGKKIPSKQDELLLRLTPTPKIADRVRGWGLTGTFVTFKAASPETTDPELVAIAQAQRERTQSDFVFANVLGRLGAGVYLVGSEAQRFEARADAVAALVRALR